MISLLPAIPQMRYKFIYGWVTFKNINTFLYSLLHLIWTPFLPIYSVALLEVSEIHCLILVCQLISLAVQCMFSQGCLSPQCTRISSRIVLLLLLRLVQICSLYSTSTLAYADVLFHILLNFTSEFVIWDYSKDKKKINLKVNFG